MSCKVISGRAAYRGKQNLDVFEGISAEAAGSKALCLHVITIPPGGRAKPHLHEHHESSVYVVSGRAGMWFGEGLREHVWMSAGDFLYIPANTPTCHTTRATPSPASAWSPAPIPMNRRASRSSTFPIPDKMSGPEAATY